MPDRTKPRLIDFARLEADRLFAAQEIPAQDLEALARTLGLNTEQFNQCLSSGKYLENIQSSAAGARRMGIFGTPAFLIGTLSEDGGFVRVKKVLSRPTPLFHCPLCKPAPFRYCAGDGGHQSKNRFSRRDPFSQSRVELA